MKDIIFATQWSAIQNKCNWTLFGVRIKQNLETALDQSCFFHCSIFGFCCSIGLNLEPRKGVQRWIIQLMYLTNINETCFFNVVPSSEETSFWTTFYGIYFSHLNTYYTLQIMLARPSVLALFLYCISGHFLSWDMGTPYSHQTKLTIPFQLLV